jgi:hypothetical protein
MRWQEEMSSLQEASHHGERSISTIAGVGADFAGGAYSWLRLSQVVNEPMITVSASIAKRVLPSRRLF